MLKAESLCAGIFCVIALALLIPETTAAAVPDAAQPGKSVFASLYGFPGAGLSLDGKFWQALGIGTSFTGGQPGLYPGHRGGNTDDDNLVFEVYLNATLARSPALQPAGRYGISVTGGVWVAEGKKRPLLGLCGSYRISEKVGVRANAVYGPSAGVELGYSLAENLEATLTVLSGRGIFGLRLVMVERKRHVPEVDDLARGRR